MNVKDPLLWISMGVKVLAGHPYRCPDADRCPFTPTFWLRVEAATVMLDMRTAETYAGREPRGSWARQVPT